MTRSNHDPHASWTTVDWSTHIEKLKRSLKDAERDPGHAGHQAETRIRGQIRDARARIAKLEELARQQHRDEDANQ